MLKNGMSSMWLFVLSLFSLYFAEAEQCTIGLLPQLFFRTSEMGEIYPNPQQFALNSSRLVLMKTIQLLYVTQPKTKKDLVVLARQCSLFCLLKS